MKSFFIAIMLRLGIGFGIALIGIVAAAVSGNWNVDFKWFEGIGLLCIVIAILPYLQWTRRAFTRTYSMRLTPFSNKIAMKHMDGPKSRHSQESLDSANMTISLLLIGVINVIIPYVVRHYVG